MNITRLENEIVKAIEIEARGIKKTLEEIGHKEEIPLNDLEGLTAFVRKCFKEHNKNKQQNKEKYD